MSFSLTITVERSLVAQRNGKVKEAPAREFSPVGSASMLNFNPALVAIITFTGNQKTQLLGLFKVSGRVSSPYFIG